MFRESLCEYIKANIWESQNIDRSFIPSIERYLAKRPIFSGGELALELTLFVLEEELPDVYDYWQELTIYRTLAAKLIFISNDLLSYEKEKNINDHHNWVTLLQKFHKLSEEDSIQEVINHHNAVLDQFLCLDDKFKDGYNLKKQTQMILLKNIKYQVSGAVEWSIFDTKRYTDF